MFDFNVQRLTDHFISYFINFELLPETRYFVQLSGSGFAVDQEGVPYFTEDAVMDRGSLWADVTIDGETGLTRVYSNLDLSVTTPFGFDPGALFRFMSGYFFPLEFEGK